MRKLTSRPAWTELQAHPLANAPRWIKYLVSGLAMKHYAKRGTGPDLEIIVWNKTTVYKIQDSDRR